MEGLEGPGSQDDTIEIVDSCLYYKAARGKIDAFKRQDPNRLKQLVTPFEKNTILHIHIAARCSNFACPSYYFQLDADEHEGFQSHQDDWRRDSVKFVKDVIRICPDLLHQPNAKDETPLHIAARYGHEDIVRILADENERIFQEDQEVAVRLMMLRMVNKSNDSALHEAARYGHLEAMKELMKRDGDCYSYGTNNAGETPLYLAAERGFSTAVDQMLEADKLPAYQGPGERTALHAAVLCKDEETTKKILGKMKFLAKKADKQGRVPLHYAAQLGYLTIVKILLDGDKSAAYIANTNDDDKTPLLLAAKYGQDVIMKELISRCPGCWEQVDVNGQNVLHYAVKSGNNFAISTILEDKALSNLINGKDKDGNTPLHHHVTSDNYMKYFICHPKVDRHALNNRNFNPLDVLVARECLLLNQTQCKKALENMSGTKSSQRIVYREENRGEKKEEVASSVAEEDHGVPIIKSAREIYLVVATLIATVTFAAGFTLPGGYYSSSDNKNNSELQGHAMLTKDLAFKAFVVFDTIALILSSTAVFYHLWMALDTNKTNLVSNFYLTLILTICAIPAMLLAFITGTYAVLSNCLGLAIATIILGCPFFLLYMYIYLPYPYRLILKILEDPCKRIRYLLN